MRSCRYSIYLTLAIPSIIQSSVLSIGTMALQVIVNKAGIDYINGYTAANTIFNLFLLPIVAISTGFETFASQNIGAAIHERVRGGYQFLIKEGILNSFPWMPHRFCFYLHTSHRTFCHGLGIAFWLVCFCCF